MKPEDKFIQRVTPEDCIEMEKNPPLEVLNIIKCFREEIESGGGTVLDFGFCIPAPRRSKEYTCKKTKRRMKTKGVRKDLKFSIIELVNDEPGQEPF